MTIEYTDFVRKPFVVSAVQVTPDNIEELAPLVGTLRHKEDGTAYISVDRRRIPNGFRVFPGFWVTTMGENVRCYSPKVFAEQFTVMTDDIQELVDAMVTTEA